MGTVLTALTTGFSEIAETCMSAIANTLPLALPVMGAMVVIGLAVGFFKRFVH